VFDTISNVPYIVFNDFEKFTYFSLIRQTTGPLTRPQSARQHAGGIRLRIADATVQFSRFDARPFLFVSKYGNVARRGKRFASNKWSPKQRPVFKGFNEIYFFRIGKKKFELSLDYGAARRRLYKNEKIVFDRVFIPNAGTYTYYPRTERSYRGRRSVPRGRSDLYSTKNGSVSRWFYTNSTVANVRIAK